jgi:Protein of unknown function (DUF2889)
MPLDPAVLRDRERYERVMDGVTDNTHDDAFTHTVRLTEPDRAVELSVLALPSPAYTVREACARALAGDVDPTVVAAVSKLAGVRMIAGLTRTVAVAVGEGAGAALIVDAAVEAARLARQVAKSPRERAERAADGDPWECWQLDTAGWIDLPDSCFTYSDAGRALFGTRTITTRMQPDLYSPRPGQTRVFVRRKVVRLERLAGRLSLFHSMHDNVHGFELTYELDIATGRILRADSVTSRLPYAGICSEPQGKIKTLIGETVDAGLRRRLSAHVGGESGCAQLFDLTADLLKFLA